jgi:hypothetical protein
MMTERVIVHAKIGIGNIGADAQLGAGQSHCDIPILSEVLGRG